MTSSTVDFRELVERHYEPLYRFAYRLTGSAVEAEDLTQQTFLSAQTKQDQLRDPSSAKAWLYQILRNAWLRLLRDRAPRREVSLGDLPEPSADDSGEVEVDQEQLQLALNRIPEEFRYPLVLFYFGEFSYREIAEQLKVPIGTVMSRLSRGKNLLRRHLEPAMTSSP